MPVVPIRERKPVSLLGGGEQGSSWDAVQVIRGSGPAGETIGEANTM